MQQFAIHHQLLVDARLLGRLKHCHVLLHKNALVPWFILVPEVDSADLLDLPARQRNKIIRECSVIAGFIKQHFHTTKINFAALGNRVPQLHLHVIGRSVSDPCWPKPVWDNLVKIKTYSTMELESICNRLRQDFNLHD